MYCACSAWDEVGRGREKAQWSLTFGKPGVREGGGEGLGKAMS